MSLNQDIVKIKEKRVCTITDIRIATFVGGPLSGFYFISKNFNTWGNKVEARKNLLYGLFFTVLLCILPSEISVKMPRIFLPFLYIYLIGYYASILQKNEIDKELLMGVKKYSTLKLVCISSSFTLLSLVFLFCVVYFSDISNIQHDIGTMYYEGIVFPQNNIKAAKWYRRAAERNNSSAQNDIGVMYHEGKGMPHDDKEAAQWYLKSARQGNPVGEENIGFAYHTGQGVPQNDIEAVKWTQKSAEQGYAQAQFNLASAYHTGIGIPQSNSEAIKWLKKSAAQNFQPAVDLLRGLNEDKEVENKYRLKLELPNKILGYN